ncbi:MAG TPA: hypothetical protein VMY76_12800 [Gemmatimonadales bacterium]|nr:hypothetical protein [Gemmatimonadales bacterium]
MSRPLVLSTGMLAVALGLGCGDQPASSEPGSIPPPVLRTERSPDGPGAFAIHIPEASFYITDDDPAPGLTLLAGTTYAQHLHLCETGEPPFPMDRLLVFRPDGSIKTRVLGAKVPMVVFQSLPPHPTDDFFADVCSEEFLALPHLEGTGQFLDRDNDLTLSFNRANSFGFRIVGQVRSAAGERFKFLAKSRSLILRSGEPRTTFNLTLRPIGR